MSVKVIEVHSLDLYTNKFTPIDFNKIDKDVECVVVSGQIRILVDGEIIWSDEK